MVHYMNVQSLLSNKCEVELLLKKYSPELLLLSETRITDDIDQSEYEIVNYNCVNCTSNSRHTGGVMLYIKKGMQYEVDVVSKVDYFVWILKVFVWIDKQKWSFVVVYRSPSSAVNDFMDFYTNWYAECLENESNVIVMGDFNINLLANDGNKMKENDRYHYRSKSNRNNKTTYQNS